MPKKQNIKKPVLQRWRGERGWRTETGRRERERRGERMAEAEREKKTKIGGNGEEERERF